MKIDLEIDSYLTNEKFSSAFYMPFSPHKYEDVSRTDRIVQIVHQKRVIHIGCCDHLPLIEEKIKKNQWLHKRLIDNTQKCIGIDINREAVEHVVHKLNIKDVYCLDILKEDIDFGDEMWDYIVLGEMIEHVDNPVLFLQTIRQKFQGSVKKIVITAPNVLNIFQNSCTNKGIECINTDHRYWFSPYTLCKVVSISGFKNIEITFAQMVKLPFCKAVIRYLKKRLNMTRYYHANHYSSILIVAEL